MEVSGQLHDPVAVLLVNDLWYPLDRSSIDSRAGMDVVEKSDISCPCRKSNPDSSVVYPIAELRYRSNNPSSTFEQLRPLISYKGKACRFNHIVMRSLRHDVRKNTHKSRRGLYLTAHPYVPTPKQPSKF
jgi:hypothetical protein